MLRDALMETPTGVAEIHAQKRMKAMHDLIELSTNWFSDAQRMDEQTIRQLMRMGSKVQKLLEMKDKLTLVKK
jgi:DNA-binding transcriptional regulator GbsR (MarR family)